MNPQAEYTARLRDRDAAVARIDRLNERISTVRVVLFCAALGVAWAAIAFDTLSIHWVWLPIGLFIGVAIRHSQVRRERVRAQRAATFYRDGLARIEDRWLGNGQTGERFADPHHVYAADLDLFGRGSLFELLSTARTRMGEARLASWLLEGAGTATIRERHEAVAELRERLDLREQIAVLGAEAKVGVQPEALVKWAEGTRRVGGAWTYWLACVLPLAAIAAVVVWYRFNLITPLVGVLVVEAGVLQRLGKRIRATLHDAENAFEDLRLLAALLERIEQEQFAGPLFNSLLKSLASHEEPASRTMSRLATVVQLVESNRNPILQVLQVPLMYALHTALAAERWRARNGHVVRRWLAAIGELEALLSIAGYSYEHPDDVVPEIVAGPARFVATRLGHPLIPRANCVRNDVSVGGTAKVLVISGSNMSGKSTLLRSVGINTVLAMAGAPVRAGRLEISAVQIGASIRVNDSLHEGSSRFYAEITRLRALYELSKRELAQGERPLLFLLDELLQGTNSKDRRIGAEGVVRAFARRGAIGFISTHDLALTDIEGLAPGELENFHFEDAITDGTITFDFTLRPGVVTKSNGVELMRSIGLDV